MKQKVLLERKFNGKSYKQNCNFRNSCHKNQEFFFSRTRILKNPTGASPIINAHVSYSDKNDDKYMYLSYHQ